MQIKNVSRSDLEHALQLTNKKYDGNLTFDRIEPKGSMWLVTLKVKNSHGKGSRLSFPDYNKNGKQRHLINACWHAHGDFFEILLLFFGHLKMNAYWFNLISIPHGEQ